ncbi:hypothetical protein [Natrinema versiforme]|uniref:Uncharacterized protein n=1 Tax=Natrinema versiforme JCM 10478 TaxID=1227496 RepID=L9YBQ6_9EURY|nr:hypothetical protein [Natrinema versiforme]ELY71494.1 hypothetical protein C489_00281 [Natrinema versiforme JCM 10478]
MTETVDLQGSVIGAGLLLAVGFLVYGTVVGGTIVGIDAAAAATWVLALTFIALAGVHASVGQYDFALGHGGAAAGWLFVLLGSTGFQTVLGLVLLALSGSYIAIRTLRARSDGTDGDGTDEDGTDEDDTETDGKQDSVSDDTE